MAIINAKSSIPRIGDIVEKLIVSKDKRFVQITFDNGSKIVISVDPNEFARGVSKPVVSGAKPPTKPMIQKKVVTSTKVNEMVKNTSEDPNYQAKVLATIAKIDGKSPAEIKEMLEQSQPHIGGTIGAPVMESNDAWKEQAVSVLDKSQDRATKLAEQYARSHGAKTESAFKGGASSIEMK